MLSKKTLLPLRNTGLALHKLTSRAPRQKLFVEEGFSNYTVVSAVYNVGKYLHDFFTSIVNQTLSFENNIYLIMVDDGSTDDSAAIIKRWQKKFPDNILYLHKENGGQASARNMGLPHVMTEWVTFIDPDDFLDHNYFLEVDRCIERNSTKDVQMVCCNLIFYYEDKNTFSDTHPLNYKFKNKETILPYENLGNHIQLSASTVFFKKENINLFQFDESIKPNAEDMHFIGIYLVKLKHGKIIFLKNSIYYYRKRENKSSTLDIAWNTKEKFSNVIEGYKKYINENLKRFDGKLPDHVQYTLLYEIFWYLKVLINQPEAASHLTKEEQKKFVHSISSLIDFIDYKNIMNFNLRGYWFFFKAGIILSFKKMLTHFFIIYIDDFDLIKNQIKLYYYTLSISSEKISIDGKNIVPSYKKIRRHDFLDQTFLFEITYWLPLKNFSDASSLSFAIDNYTIYISCKDKWFSQSNILIKEIKNIFLDKKRNIFNKYKNSWIFLDKDTQADDNAEHLYRYIKDKTDRKIFFLLYKNSHDWNRLYKEGFHLIPFGTREHKQALLGCDTIISSHIDPHIYNHFKNDAYKYKNIVFLQHGVINQDLSRWLNTKKINTFLTSTKDEYNSIIKNYNRYKFSSKEVILAGLPRHDRLLHLAKELPSQKKILIIPTWRKYLTGETVHGNKRELISHFMDSDYAKTWKNFLISKELHDISLNYNYKIIFFPHVNIQPYLNEFCLPSYIEVKKHNDCSIQDLFIQSSLMITDYSSVAFEMAFLQKPVVYYQFDKDIFFKGHTYQIGYFDYKKHGFGPIVYTQNILLEEIKNILQHHCKPVSPYIERMKAAFCFRDGHNCERVYNAMCNLDKENQDIFSSINLLYEFAYKATEAKKYNDAIDYWKSFYDLTTKEVQGPVYLWIGRMFLDQGKYASFQKIYNYCYSMYSQTRIPEMLYAEYNVINRNYTEAISVYKTWDTNDFDVRSLFFYARALAEKKETVLLENIYTEHKEIIESIEAYVILFQAYIEMAKCNWEQVVFILEENIEKFTNYILRSLEPEIILFKAYLRQKNIDMALKYKNIFKDNSLLNREIIYMLIKSKKQNI